MRIFYVTFLIFLLGAATAKGGLKLKSSLELGNNKTIPFSIGWIAEPYWEIDKRVDLYGGIRIANEQRFSYYIANTIKFPLNKLELQIQEKFLYNSFGVWNMQEYSVFGGLQLYAPHFDVLLGVSSRLIKPLQPITYESIVEPFNWQYDVGLRLFKTSNPWNLRLGASNFDTFYFERMESLILSLKGEYNLSKKFSIYCNGILKPAGNFHLSANYYGYYIQTGMIWNIW
jgi:hypothetical protein